MPGQNRGPSVHLAAQTLSTRRMQQGPRHPLGKSGGVCGVVKKHYYREKSREGGQKSRWSQFRGWAPEKVQEQGWGSSMCRTAGCSAWGGRGSSRPQDWEGAAQRRGSDLRGKNSQLSWPAHALPVLHSFAPSRTQCHLLWPAHLPQARLVSTLLTRTWQATMCPAASGHAEDRGEASWEFSGLCTMVPMPFPSTPQACHRHTLSSPAGGAMEKKAVSFSREEGGKHPGPLQAQAP